MLTEDKFVLHIYSTFFPLFFFFAKLYLFMLQLLIFISSIRTCPFSYHLFITCVILNLVFYGFCGFSSQIVQMVAIDKTSNRKNYMALKRNLPIPSRGCQHKLFYFGHRLGWDRILSVTLHY